MNRWQRVMWRIGLIVALLAGGGAAATAQSVGRLFFLQVHSGLNLIGGVDEHGRFHVLASGTQSGLAHQTVRAVTDNGLLLYGNAADGGGSIVQLDGTALPRFRTGFGFSPGWASITGIGSHLFFYNGANVGAIVTINPDQSTTQTQTVTNLSTWTNIVATANYLVFYNAASGVISSAVISNIEQLAETSGSSTIIHASLFASVGDDLMLYDPGSGNYKVLQILYNGSRTDAISQGASGVTSKGYTTLARLDRSLLFYSINTGAALIGTIDQTGTNGSAWRVTQTTKLLAGWTNVVTAGQYLVFYNETSGALSVGFISTKGQWAQTDYQSDIGAGFSSVAATAR